MISRINLIITGGQAIWAIAQAGIILVLSHFSGIETVGLYTLGLSIFAPLCLIGSLNLRTLLAVDFNEEINLKTAYKIRLITITLSLILTAAVTLYASKSITDWLPAFLLVFCRSADQISDITTGHFQRINKHKLISLSLTGRGIASIIPLLLIPIANISTTKAALLSIILLAAITYYIDIKPSLQNRNCFGQENIKSLLASIRNDKWSAPFPFLDSLNANSLRYGIIIVSSASSLGAVGIAQTLFTPIQLILTSIGYTYLTNIKKLIKEKKWDNVLIQNNKGILIGLSICISFIFAALAIPEYILQKAVNHSGNEIKSLLVLTGVAMLPSSMNSLLGHTLLATKSNIKYTLSPLIGLSTFWILFLLIIILANKFNIEWVFYLFLVSNSIRFIFTFQSTKKQIDNLKQKNHI